MLKFQTSEIRNIEPLRFLRLTFPREIAATNVYDSGGNLGEELGEILDEYFWAFSCFIC